MQITGFRCQCKTDPQAILPLDHYSSGACPAPPFMAEWITTMLMGLAGDTEHCDGKITATRLLGCPRQSILSDEIPLALDVRRLHSGQAGTSWHKAIREGGARADSQYELRLPSTELFGVEVSGRCDRVSLDWSEIEDWKTHGESSMGFKWRNAKSGRVDRELAAQLNLYRLIIARLILKVPDAEYRPRLIGWHMAMVRAQRGPGEPPPKPGYKGRMPEEPPPPGFRVTLPIMSEDEIGRLRPFDDEDSPGMQPYSVRDIVKMYVDYRAARVAGATLTDALRAHVPLVGRGVWRGTMCTRYCAALEACNEVEGVGR